MTSKIKLLLVGGTGMVGSAIAQYSTARDAEVYYLSTRHWDRSNYFHWDPYNKIMPDINIDFDAVINLAGANIGDKFWTKSRKRELINSRILSTRLLCDAINQGKIKTKHLIQMSAIGYYGDRGQQWLDETSSKGSGFLSDLVYQWENSCQIIPKDILVTILRLGIVIDPHLGAWPKMIAGLKYRIGILMGGGHHYISSIPLSTIPIVISHIISRKTEGLYNLVDHLPKTQRQMLSDYCSLIGVSPIWISIPSIAMNLLGDMRELLTYSQRVSTKLDSSFYIESQN